MKRREFHSEISNLSLDELKSRARALSEELMKLRFRAASNQLNQSHRINELRKNLARIQTVLASKRTENKTVVS